MLFTIKGFSVIQLIKKKGKCQWLLTKGYNLDRNITVRSHPKQYNIPAQQEISNDRKKDQSIQFC